MLGRCTIAAPITGQPQQPYPPGCVCIWATAARPVLAASDWGAPGLRPHVGRPGFLTPHSLPGWPHTQLLPRREPVEHAPVGDGPDSHPGLKPGRGVDHSQYRSDIAPVLARRDTQPPGGRVIEESGAESDDNAPDGAALPVPALRLWQEPPHLEASPRRSGHPCAPSQISASAFTRAQRYPHPMPTVTIKASTVAWLTSAALDHLWDTIQDPVYDTCCPVCCGTCAAILQLQTGGHLEAIVTPYRRELADRVWMDDAGRGVDPALFARVWGRPCQDCAAEREADADLAAGRVVRFGSDEEMDAFLNANVG